MTSPSEPDDSIGFLISDVARLLRKNFNRRMQSSGLTQEQCRAILHLSRSEGIRQVELADLMEIRPITLARLLDKLQENGLVERRRDTEDRRAFRLYLTDAARDVLEKILAIGVATREDANKDVPAADLETMYTVLNRLKANLLRVEEAQRPGAGKGEASR